MEVIGMRNVNKLVLSALCAAISSNNLYAQETETGFFTDVETSLLHDDNIYRVTDELAQADNFISITPKLQFIGAIGKQRFDITYSGDYAKFNDANDADFADHDLRGKIELEHTIRFGTSLEAGYQKEHEEPGSINRIQLNLSEYNKFDQNFVLARAYYGQESSIGRIELSYRKANKDYLNNGLDFLDSDLNQVTATFTYRVAPKTKIYIDALLADLDYEPGTNFELDNKFKRYRAGVTWNFTNKLTGDINIGYQDRNYEQETLRDIDGLAYNGEVIWAINSYTSLAVEANRESIDSSIEQAGGFLRTSYAANLDHKLTSLVTLIIDVGYSTDELVFNTARQDDRSSYKVELDYEFMSNLSVGVSYQFEKRESTVPTAEYKANVVALNLKYSLD